MADRYYSRSSLHRSSSRSSSRSSRSSRKKRLISLPQLIILLLLLVVAAQLTMLLLDRQEAEQNHFEAVTVKPETKTFRRDNRTLVNHTVNGNLYLVEVRPTVGAPYFLIDQYGYGELELRRNPAGLHLRPPAWATKRW